MRPHASLRRAALLVLIAPLVRARVIQVDPGNDPNMALSSAIQAAADGDTLILLPGGFAAGLAGSAAPPGLRRPRSLTAHRAGLRVLSGVVFDLRPVRSVP